MVFHTLTASYGEDKLSWAKKKKTWKGGGNTAVKLRLEEKKKLV